MAANKKGLAQGCSAIITGASSGIGRALAIMLAKQFGARIVLNARNEKLLAEVAEEVKTAGGLAEIVPGDISDKTLSAKLAETCITKYGGIDVLVNNAGLARTGTLFDITPEDWEYVFGINFFGALYATYAVLPQLKNQGHGKIVNVASVAGKVSFPGSVCYAASKFAMTGMSEGMAAELCRQNIDVVTVCPGWVRTEFFENNKLPATKNPTAIANRSDVLGWIMRNCLSISAEDTAREIIQACQKGGPQEIVLTAPGKVVTRLSAYFPALMFSLSKLIPAER